MKTVRVTIDPSVPASLNVGRIDPARVDATTENEIKAQQAADEAAAMQDAAKFVHRVRKRLGLSQAEFSQRIDRIGVRLDYSYPLLSFFGGLAFFGPASR